MPATHLTTNNLSGTPLYLVSNLNGFSNLYQVWKLGGTPPQLTFIQLEGPNFSIPPNGKQKGGGILLDTGDNRILQTVFRGGQLWATHHTGCGLGSNAQTESCVRVLRFTPTDASVTLAYDKTFGLANQYMFFPAISVNQAGDVAAVFQRSSQNMFLSSAIAGKRASSTNFDKIAQLRTGSCHYEVVPDGATNRTGDFSGAQVDPVDDRSFWVAAEHGVKIPGFSLCLWGTRIAKIAQ